MPWGVRGEEPEMTPSYRPDPLELPFTELGKVGREACFVVEGGKPTPQGRL